MCNEGDDLRAALCAVADNLAERCRTEFNSYVTDWRQSVEACSRKMIFQTLLNIVRLITNNCIQPIDLNNKTIKTKSRYTSQNKTNRQKSDSIQVTLNHMNNFVLFLFCFYTLMCQLCLHLSVLQCTNLKNIILVKYHAYYINIDI